jgi:hypothetical protein
LTSSVTCSGGGGSPAAERNIAAIDKKIIIKIRYRRIYIYNLLAVIILFTDFIGIICAKFLTHNNSPQLEDNK